MLIPILSDVYDADEATYYGSGGGGYVQGSPFSQAGSPSGRVSFSLQIQPTLNEASEGRITALIAAVDYFTTEQDLTTSYRIRVEIGRCRGWAGRLNGDLV